MEKSNWIKRSEAWNNIYEVLARLDLKETTGDCMDRPSAATEIEELFLKLLPIQNVSKQRELLIAFKNKVNDNCTNASYDIQDYVVDDYLSNL